VAQLIRSLQSDKPLGAGARETFARDVLEGLSARHKSIPAIYHYDAEGSRLFEQITRLPEYYLTRCENDSLRRNRGRIADRVMDEPLNLIEFGPGDGSKTKALVEHLVARGADFQYVPIDISRSALEKLTAHFRARFPRLKVSALATDFSSGINWLNDRYRRRNLVLFLGSNIGNFSDGEAEQFLLNLSDSLNEGDLVLIGFDSKKDIEQILKAYNDSQGVTAEFHLNVLRRINRELAGNFDTDSFRYIGSYDVLSSRINAHLVSRGQQQVHIGDLGRSFTFADAEPIHVECSCKYDESDIEKLAGKTGYAHREHLYDSRRYFVDAVWEVTRDRSTRE
jgi:dimethylhistidine N-methyltransferase